MVVVVDEKKFQVGTRQPGCANPEPECANLNSNPDHAHITNIQGPMYKDSVSGAVSAFKAGLQLYAMVRSTTVYSWQR